MNFFELWTILLTNLASDYIYSRKKSDFQGSGVWVLLDNLGLTVFELLWFNLHLHVLTFCFAGLFTNAMNQNKVNHYWNWVYLVRNELEFCDVFSWWLMKLRFKISKMCCTGENKAITWSFLFLFQKLNVVELKRTHTDYSIPH